MHNWCFRDTINQHIKWHCWRKAVLRNILNLKREYYAFCMCLSDASWSQSYTWKCNIIIKTCFGVRFAWDCKVRKEMCVYFGPLEERQIKERGKKVPNSFLAYNTHYRKTGARIPPVVTLLSTTASIELGVLGWFQHIRNKQIDGSI